MTLKPFPLGHKFITSCLHTPCVVINRIIFKSWEGLGHQSEQKQSFVPHQVVREITLFSGQPRHCPIISQLFRDHRCERSSKFPTQMASNRGIVAKLRDLIGDQGTLKHMRHLLESSVSFKLLHHMVQGGAFPFPSAFIWQGNISAQICSSGFNVYMIKKTHH